MKKTLHSLLLVAAICATLTACQPNTPSAYIDKLYSAMINKDFVTVVEMMPGGDSISNDDKEGAIEMMKLFDGFSGGVTAYEIVDEEIAPDGKSATVKVKVTYGTGEVEEETTHLVKNGKAWRPASQI